MYVERKLRVPAEEVAYWRKENALQGWFEEKYGIENLGKVVLTEELIDELLEDLKDHELKPTEGFFYGSNEDLDDEWFEVMIREWKNIKAQIIANKDYEYYYTCWY